MEKKTIKLIKTKRNETRKKLEKKTRRERNKTKRKINTFRYFKINSFDFRRKLIIL